MDERLLDTNQHGVLRVPGQLWMSFLVLTRHWWLALAILVSLKGGGSGLLDVTSGISWYPLAAQCPCLLLAWAAGSRQPTAGLILRTLWRFGPFIVISTALLNLCWTGWNLAWSDNWQPRPELALICFSVLDMAIAWMVWSSPYLRQVFAEFPASVARDLE